MVNVARTLSPPGKTRVCPHCKSVILDSANICPACHHHLRFGQKTDAGVALKYSAFRVEGTIRQPTDAKHSEYSVVISIRDQQGQEIKRQVIDVGAMEPAEQRTFNLSVEVSPARR
jgi:hypothetical protein